MKLALNGALTIGTLDGANVEIRHEVGEENIFIFGLTATEVQERQQHGLQPWDYYHGDVRLKQVLDHDRIGLLFTRRTGAVTSHWSMLLTHGGDQYLLLADYASYIACQESVDAVYREPREWTRKAILNVANMGKFFQRQDHQGICGRDLGSESRWRMNKIKGTGDR